MFLLLKKKQQVSTSISVFVILYVKLKKVFMSVALGNCSSFEGSYSQYLEESLKFSEIREQANNCLSSTIVRPAGSCTNTPIALCQRCTAVLNFRELSEIKKQASRLLHHPVVRPIGSCTNTPLFNNELCQAPGAEAEEWPGESNGRSLKEFQAARDQQCNGLSRTNLTAFSILRASRASKVNAFVSRGD